MCSAAASSQAWPARSVSRQKKEEWCRECSKYKQDASVHVSSDAMANMMSFSAQSWAGSGACLVAGMLASMACVVFLEATDSGDGPLQALSMGRIAWGCGISALVGAITESLPIPEIDNITVPLAVVLAGHCVF